MSKRVLVLGATGAMGQHLVPILVKRGYTVDAIANFEPRVPFTGANFHKVENAKVLSWHNDCLLPTIMCKRLVGFCHSVCVFFLLNRTTRVIHSIK